MLKMFRATTLQRYVLTEFLKTFFLALAACTLFILLLKLKGTASEYEEYGVSMGQVAQLFPYLLPQPLAYAIPLAAMIAATMVFGRMTAENEMIAVQAGGAPIRILAAPILLASVLLCCVSLWCTQGGQRWGFSTIKNDVLKLGNPEVFLKYLQKEGQSLTLPLDNGDVAHINMLPHDEGRKPIHISYFTGQDVGLTLLAADYQAEPSGTSPDGKRKLTLRLKGMRVLGKEPAFSDEVVREFTLPALDKIINIDDTRGTRGWWQNWLEAREIEESLRRRRNFLLQRASDLGASAVASSPMDVPASALAGITWAETRMSSESIFDKGGATDRIRSEKSECARKLSLSFIPLSLTVLGIGLGLLVRKSQLLVGVLLGIVVYALVYYPMMIICKELANAGKLGLWALWLPNISLFGAGYGLWRAYERGWLANTPAWMAAIGTQAIHAGYSVAHALWQPLVAFRDWFIGLLRCKTDGYIAGSFLVPLIIVLLSVGALLTALDFVEHGGEVIEGIARCEEKRFGLPSRNTTEAVLDVATYYSIRALEFTSDLLPLLILVAGVACVFVLVRNNEHLILKASGVPLQRAFRPIIIVTVLLSVSVMILRETVMPDLIMRRDYLKPLVYHRNPAPTALALHTTDMNGSPVLFQMSQYTSGQRTGRDLRVYLLGDAKARRLPSIVADHAVWDGTAWKLQTQPKAHGSLKSGAEKPPMLDHGYMVRADTASLADGADPDEVPERRPLSNVKEKLESWRGGVTPSIIESERLGPAVMNLRELSAASEVRREFSVELWRRVFEVAMGVFLLWTALPLLLKEDVRPFFGIGLSLLMAVLYWGLNTGFSEAAKENFVPTWAPVIPHVLFMIIGCRNYYGTMET